MSTKNYKMIAKLESGNWTAWVAKTTPDYAGASYTGGGTLVTNTIQVSGTYLDVGDYYYMMIGKLITGEWVTWGSFYSPDRLGIYYSGAGNLIQDTIQVSRFYEYTGVPPIFVNEYSLLFGGTDEYVTMGDVLGFERTDPFSMSAWVKTTATSGFIVGKNDNSTPWRGCHLALGGGGYVTVGITNNTSGNRIQVRATSLFANDNNWHLVTMTYDGSSTASGVSIYVDGLIQSINIFHDTLTSTTLTTTSFTIGGRGTDGTDWNFNGFIDEVSVWDRQLSSNEVSEIYNNGRPADLGLHSANNYLVGWWRMGENSSFPSIPDLGSGGLPYGLVRDISGNNYNGNMVSMEQSDIQSDVPFGKAVLFDGSNDYVTMGNVLGFERTDAFSVGFWIKAPYGATGYHQLIGKQESSGNYRGWSVQLEKSTGTLRLVLRSVITTNQIVVITNNTTDDAWHYVLFTYDGSSQASGVSVYVDGVSGGTVDSDSLTGTITNSVAFMLGSMNAAGDWYSGHLDEVTIWDKELSLSEALSLYNNGRLPVNPKNLLFAGNLVGWWTMGDGDVYPTLKDYSNNGYDGTMTGMAISSIVDCDTVGRSESVFSKGSLIFDGSEHINCGNILNYEYNDPFSISFWVKTTTTSNSHVVSKMTGASAYRGYATYIYGTGKYSFFLINDSSITRRMDVETATITVNDGRWHHIVSTYDGSSLASGVKVYIDGNEVALSVTNDNLGSNTIIHSTNLNIAGRTDGSVRLNGSIDEVAFYNKVLDLNEVKEIYNQGIPDNLKLLSTSENIDAYWRLGDSTSNEGIMTNMNADDIVADVP